MSMKRSLAVVSLLAAGELALHAATLDDAREDVRQTETAFAKTMADRDHAAFASFLAPDTVFFFGPRVLRGKQAVADAWKQFYDEKAAPFAWGPQEVEVLEGGALAFTSGPVFDPAGKRTGTFNSVWRREKDGKWRIVFDKGCPRCDCAPAEKPKP